MVNSEGRKKGLLVVMSLRSGLLETEDAGCSLPPLYNGAVFTGVGRLVGELVRKQGGGELVVVKSTAESPEIGSI